MTIKELRDFLNGLSEEVVDYEVKSIGIYRPEYDVTTECDIVMDTDNEHSIKSNRGLFLTLDDFYLENDCELCIVPNDMQIVKLEEE